jgi:Uma2 family endonuclease
VTILAPRHRYTFAEYLELEEVARVRHEFYDGEIYAMAGGTPEHAAISAAITSHMGAQLAGMPCRIYSSALRVRVLATGLATYPDVTVICGPSERDPSSPTHVTNPRVVFEVLSPSTGDYDRNEKRQHYQRIPSLAAIVLVAQDGTRAEVWTRVGDEWQMGQIGPTEDLVLESVSCTLSLSLLGAAARSA